VSGVTFERPDDHVEPPARDASSRWLVLVIVCLAQFMVILDATVVNVALPSIQTDLGFSAANLQWVINSYTLIFGGFLLLGGRAGDLFGRRRLFLIGVGIFSFASLLNGLATTDTWLVASPGCRDSAAPSSPPPRCRSSRRRSPRVRTGRRRSGSGVRSPPAGARSASCSAAC
jgi:hypothetical protein